DRRLRTARPVARHPPALRKLPGAGAAAACRGGQPRRSTRHLGGAVTTGLVWHELYMWHDTGTGAWVMPAGLTVQPFGHIESAESKRRIRNLVEVSGLIDPLVQLKPRPATEDEILRLHTRGYVDRIKRLSSEAGGEAGEETPFGRGSYEIALLAAGGCIVAVDAVLDAKVDNAYALVRPPGHHA